MDELSALIASRQGPAPPAPPKALPKALDLISQLTGKSLAQLLEEAEKAPDSGAKSYETVKDGPELQRVLALPSRVIDFEGPEVAALTEQMTLAFRKPGSSMRLLPIQAVALAELFTIGGLVGPIRVGGGKTLISYLAPVMFSVPQPRPLLLIPAGVKKKTIDAFDMLSKHWKGPDPGAYRIESVQKLSVDWGGVRTGKEEESRPSMLDLYQPTIIVIDEAHLFKNPNAACTLKLGRYLVGNPEVKLVVLSGTFFRRSLKDIAAMTNRALGSLSPCPLRKVNVDEWAGALDEKVSSLARTQPGALIQLCNEEEALKVKTQDNALDAIRSAYGRRFTSTPGVVASKETELGTSLQFRELRIGHTRDPLIDEHFKTFRKFWITPKGLDVPDGICFKRHALEMSLGFEYHWDPQPPDEWILLRRAWGKLCRYILKSNRRNLDSEKQVTDAVVQKLYPGIEVLEAWRKIKPTFVPNTVGAWFSTETLDFAAHWAEQEKGLVWTSHVEFGRALAARTGLAYYGRKGVSDTGVYIMDAKPGYPAIASTASNKLGRDLQHHWYKNLVISPEGDGLTWEQRTARTHRMGQPEDTVYCDWLANCAEHIADFSQALKDAGTQERITGQPQKLLYGDHTRADHFPEVHGRLGRWGATD